MVMISLLLLLSSTLLQCVAASSKIPIFVMAGQSNMAGFGYQSHLQQLAAQDDSPYAYLVDDSSSNAGSFQNRSDVRLLFNEERGVISDLVIGFGLQEEAATFGPEIGFGWTMGDFYNGDSSSSSTPILIIKVAWGSTSLGEHWRSPSAVNVSGGIERNETGIMWNRMMDMVDEAFLNLKDYFPDYFSDAGEIDGRQEAEILGFCWLQGWSDQLDLTLRAEYQANLEHFVSDVLDEFGHDTAFLIGELGQGGPAGGPQAGETRDNILDMRKYQKKVANKFGSNVQFVPTNTLVVSDGEKFNGLHHYYGRADTIVEIGNAFGEAMKPLAATPMPSASPSSSPSVSPSPSKSPTQSFVPTKSPQPSNTPTVSLLPTVSNQPSLIESKNPSVSTWPSDSPSTSSIPTRSPAPSSQPTASVEPTRVPTGTPTGMPSAAPSDSPTDSYAPSRADSDSPSISMKPTVSAVPSTMPSDVPSRSNAPSSMPSQSSSPTISMEPTVLPSATPSDMPSLTSGPSNVPSLSSSPSISMEPTVSSKPSNVPTARPSAAPFTTPGPSTIPSAYPTNTPSAATTTPSIIQPSASPSSAPVTSAPTFVPSTLPTTVGSKFPSTSPSSTPVTSTPSSLPSALPTIFDSKVPSAYPSSSPSKNVSQRPSDGPPSFSPSKNVSERPSDGPPSISPSKNVSERPSDGPATSIFADAPLDCSATPCNQEEQWMVCEIDQHSKMTWSHCIGADSPLLLNGNSNSNNNDYYCGPCHSTCLLENTTATDVCDDKLQCQFPLFGFGNGETTYQTCHWLSQQAQKEQELYCFPGGPASQLCQETCGICEDSCEDGTEQVVVESRVRKCDFLHEYYPHLRDEVCSASETVRDVCKEYCGNCAGTLTAFAILQVTVP